MGFLGGIGTLSGPLLGALVLESLQQYLTQRFSGTGTYLIAYGVLFLAVILLLPRGVIPTISQIITSRRARRTAEADVAPEAEPAVRGGVAGVAQ
jgi:branched-chain amino acid transport system permease protein